MATRLTGEVAQDLRSRELVAATPRQLISEGVCEVHLLLEGHGDTSTVLTKPARVDSIDLGRKAARIAFTVLDDDFQPLQSLSWQITPSGHLDRLHSGEPVLQTGPNTLLVVRDSFFTKYPIEEIPLES